jgi:inhibitor of cysteine peptidase
MFKKPLVKCLCIVLALIILGGAAYLVVTKVFLPQQAQTSTQSGDKTLTIELDGNTTTGYNWTYQMTPNNLIKEADHDYQPGDDENQVGAGGKFKFDFTGVAPGDAEIDFSYARPFDKDKAPAKTMKYHVRVNQDLTITVIDAQ